MSAFRHNFPLSAGPLQIPQPSSDNPSNGTAPTSDAEITPGRGMRPAPAHTNKGEIQTMTDQTARPSSGVSRRSLFRAAGVGAAIVGGGSLLEACSSGIKGTSSSGSGSSSNEITIGWIHPITGADSGFGYPDNFVQKTVFATSAFKSGITIGGKKYTFSFKSYDNQSSSTRAGDLAKQAIADGVDILFASSTPETVNAVAAECEALGTPLVCSNCPWESYYAGLGGNPASPTFVPKYSVLYFLGAEHLAKCFIPMWNRIYAKYPENHIVAAAYPNDPDGNAFRAAFPPILKAAGYSMSLSPAYTDGTTNYTSMITQFKNSGAEFFTNCPLPPDFTVMWKQSIQQGFRPKLATVAKVLLFPTDAYQMGSEAYNIATDAWWVPSLPWTSSLDGTTCSQLASEYTAAGYGQPSANLSNYTLFEIAYAAFKSVSDPHDHNEVAAALPKVNLPEAIAGPIGFSGSPAPHVAITPPVGIQWQKGTTYSLEAKVVDNTLQPKATITGDLLPTFS
jgi:branched-chain amino acid transport system substrate-binding protein